MPLLHDASTHDADYTMHRAPSQIGFYRGDVLGLLDDIQALQPTIFVSVPRLWNRIHDRVSAVCAWRLAPLCLCRCRAGMRSRVLMLDLRACARAPLCSASCFSWHMSRRRRRWRRGAPSAHSGTSWVRAPRARVLFVLQQKRIG